MDSVSDTAGEDLAEKLLDASIDQIMAIDNDWQYISWNRTAEIATGLNKEQVLGRRVMDVFPQLDSEKEFLEGFKSALGGISAFLPSKPGHFHRDFYENHFTPITGSNGSVIGAMNIVHDVSHRIKAEKELARLNSSLTSKYRELDQAAGDLANFTSITGSKLKEPIRHVYTTLELMIRSEGRNLSEHGRANIRRVQASISRINLLLEDILLLSSANAMDRTVQPVDLSEVLRHALDKLQGKIADKRAVIQSGPLPVIPGSGQMLEYLFVNILDNALKFQHDGTVPLIQVEGEYVSGENGQVSGGEEGADYYRIDFFDNGIGFRPEDAGRMFEMFEKLETERKYSGSGIGLAICRKIAEFHGGFLTAEPRPGGGSVIHCYLSTVLQTSF